MSEAGWAGFASFFLGLAVATYGPRVARKFRLFLAHLRYGVCFQYRGKGYRETIDGTNSEFCRRCGHPAGYHWLNFD